MTKTAENSDREYQLEQTKSDLIRSAIAVMFVMGCKIAIQAIPNMLDMTAEGATLFLNFLLVPVQVETAHVLMWFNGFIVLFLLYFSIAFFKHVQTIKQG